jgi:hypothetical protein
MLPRLVVWRRNYKEEQNVTEDFSGLFILAYLAAKKFINIVLAKNF